MHKHFLELRLTCFLDIVFKISIKSKHILFHCVHFEHITLILQFLGTWLYN